MGIIFFFDDEFEEFDEFDEFAVVVEDSVCWV